MQALPFFDQPICNISSAHIYQYMIIGYHRIIGLSVRLCDVLFVCDRDIKRLTRDSLFHPVPSRSEGRPRQDPPGTLRVSDCLRA